jgi:hypothetical protein
MIDQEYLRQFIPEGHGVEKIIEDELFIYVLYATNEYLTSFKNDSLIPIGDNTILRYNKQTREIQQLSYREFVHDNLDNPAFANFFAGENLTYPRLIENINRRKHINHDEIEWFLVQREFDLSKFSMSTEDDLWWKIDVEDLEIHKNFIQLFKDSNLEYKVIGDFETVFYNP